MDVLRQSTGLASVVGIVPFDVLGKVWNIDTSIRLSSEVEIMVSILRELLVPAL